MQKAAVGDGRRQHAVHAPGLWRVPKLRCQQGWNGPTELSIGLIQRLGVVFAQVGVDDAGRGADSAGKLLDERSSVLTEVELE